MKLEKIIDFFSEATTADIILTIAIIIIAVLVIGSIICMADYILKMHKMIERELKIINNHLAHLDPNKYYESRKETDNNLYFEDK